MINSALKVYTILIDLNEKTFKERKEKKLEFLESFKQDLLQMITPDNYDNIDRAATALLRQFFEFYANNDEYLIEGL